MPDQPNEDRPANPGAIGTRTAAAVLFAGDPGGVVTAAVERIGAKLVPVTGDAGPGAGEAHVFIVTLSRSTLADAVATVRAIRLGDAGVPIVAVAGRLNAAEVVELVRAGADDVAMKPVDSVGLAERLREAIATGEARRHERDRAARLARMCRRLADERQETADLVSRVAADVEAFVDDAAETIVDRVESAGAAGQFRHRVEMELNVEELLRTTLEYVLERVGVTNAAVLLPSSSGDWAVGAFVNADMPGESADETLEDLAESMPVALAGETVAMRLTGNAEIEAAIGQETAAWLGTRTLIAVPCDNKADRMAILIAFRDEVTPYSDDDLDDMRTIEKVFTAQLAKVVRVHNRTSGELQWFGFDVGETPESEPETDEGDWWKKAA